jgi:hypothetical protein
LAILPVYLAIVALSGGCGNLSPTSKPQESATVPIVSQPVVTGDAATITTAIDNKVDQTINSVIPWLIALGIVALLGCGLTAFVVYAMLKAIRSYGYIEGKKQWVQMAKACTTDGTKT